MLRASVPIVSYEVDQPGVDGWVSLSVNDREITTGNDALVCLCEDSAVVRLLLAGILASLVLPRRTRRNSVMLPGGNS